jgi:hypothetical protein
MSPARLAITLPWRWVTSAPFALAIRMCILTTDHVANRALPVEPAGVCLTADSVIMAILCLCVSWQKLRVLQQPNEGEYTIFCNETFLANELALDLTIC